MNIVKTIGIIVSIFGLSWYAQAKERAISRLDEQIQRCCDVIESKYKPAFESMNTLRIIERRKRSTSSFIAKNATTVSASESAEGPSVNSLDSIIDFLLKLRTALVNANEVINVAHKVIDNLDGLVKKLKSLRTSIYEYFYPVQPVQKPAMLILSTIKDPLSF